jgi:hypothetical protein
VDTARPESFPDFRHNSYATIHTGHQRFVVPIGPIRTFSIGFPGVSQLQNDLSLQLRADPQVSRLLLLDAWTALFDGDIRLAIILANNSLEASIKELLRTRANSLGRSLTMNQVDSVTRGPFDVTLNVLLPLAGWLVSATPDELGKLRTLRTRRNELMHKGGQPPDRVTAQDLLDVVESIVVQLEGMLASTSMGSP